MADHMIKFSEVPKGQRFQQFKDYYLLPIIITVLVICILFSILKSTVFVPKPDSCFLVATKSAIPKDFIAQIEKLYEENGADYNGDNKKLISVTDIFLDEIALREDPQLASSMQSKLMAVLLTEENIIQIVDEGMYEYFDSQGLIGTYLDLGPNNTKHPLDEKVKLPLSMAENKLYLTIRPRAACRLNDDKSIKKYENQIALIFDLFN